MTTATPPAETAPLLRTLSPALRNLERGLRTWLDSSHRYPLSTITRATLEGLATDLRRQSEALDVDRPLLVVMLMGGTGVGKSTLLNALAGGTIAQASFTRPTTRDPVVYYHESVRPDRLDPALQHCRLSPHDRPALEQKILVDTPDIDSNDLANRDKLVRLLPVADVVLYVGSQEKYHDQLGWELFLQQRRRRAFAFVLNKWDRCLHGADSGLRPDEDLLRDLQSEGFQCPLLFRTCAQLWVDHAARNGAVTGANGQLPPPERPEGEQFPELMKWLEQGLTRLEIEAIKARGVSQMLAQLQQVLTDACPPDLTEIAQRTRAAWARPLAEEAQATSEVLLNTLEPYQREIEHHFALEGQQRFHGLMNAYLRLFTRARYVGSTLRDRVSLLPRSRDKEQTPAWDLTMFTRACSDVAANRHLDARGRALVNRLLVDANNQDFPLNVLSDPVEALARLDWRQRYAQTLNEVLARVEQHWTSPTGPRRFVQSLIVWLADWIPPLAFFAAIANLLWRYFDPQGKGYQVHHFDVLLPGVVLVGVLVLFHLIIAKLLPVRWPSIRGEFEKQLEIRLQQELENVYNPVLDDVTSALCEERRQVEKLTGETSEVAQWLAQREQSAGIEGLYGQ